MRKLKIVYYRDRCRGLGMCAAIAPHYFKMERNKAVLSNGKQEKRTQTYSSRILAAKPEAEKIIKSGMACPVNAIRVVNMGTNKDLVRTRIVTHGAKRISAVKFRRKDFVMDRKGYLLIRLHRKQGFIEVGMCRKKNTVHTIITGRNPMDIYTTLARKRMLSRFEHAAYLGKELQKAFTALELGIEYVQDAPLDFGRKVRMGH